MGRPHADVLDNRSEEKYSNVEAHRKEDEIDELEL
jgi:hypothetical protein